MLLKLGVFLVAVGLVKLLIAFSRDAKGTCRAPASLPERYKPLGKRRKNAERASVCENLQRA